MVALLLWLAACETQVNTAEQSASTVRCLLREDSRAAAAVAEQALARFGNGSELLKLYGQSLLRDRTRSASAREYLEKAIALAPKDPEAHYLLAQWACLHNAEQLCLDSAKRALAAAPGNELASLQLNALAAIAAAKLGQTEVARQAWQQSWSSNLNLRVRDPLSAFQYVEFLEQNGGGAQAAVVVAAILRHNPQFGPAHAQQARRLFAKGETKEAIAAAENALKGILMNKETTRAMHMLLARAWFRAGNEAKAAEHQKWIEQNPH